MANWVKRQVPVWNEGYQSKTIYEREDGACVWENLDEYWAKPFLEGHKRWSATAADGTRLSYYRKNPKIHIDRRWKTPEAAMKAVDKEYPME